jgi:hypothetical protein
MLSVHSTAGRNGPPLAGHSVTIRGGVTVFNRCPLSVVIGTAAYFQLDISDICLDAVRSSAGGPCSQFRVPEYPVA